MLRCRMNTTGHLIQPMAIFIYQAIFRHWLDIYVNAAIERLIAVGPYLWQKINPVWPILQNFFST